MKKLNLLLLLSFCFSIFVNAEEVEIFYPDFRYEKTKTGDHLRGFRTYNVVISDSIIGDDKGGTGDQIWKRVSAKPSEEELGYTRSAIETVSNKARDQKSLSVRGYLNDSAYTTDSYAIMNAIDLTTYASSDNISATFFTMLNEAGLGDNNSTLEVYTSFDYTGDFTTASWTQLTDGLNIATDSSWTKTSLNLAPYKEESNFTLAFRYYIAADMTIDSENKPGSFYVSDVRYTTIETIEPDLSEEILQVQFNNWNLFHMVNVTSTNNQMWTRKSGLRAGLETPDSILITPEDSINNLYKSISTSAVYTDNDLKSVSPVESWTILDSIDCSNYTNTKLSFWNLSKYKKGGDSDLAIKISTDYRSMLGDSVSAVNTATWTDITSSFVLDESIGYDSQWTKSEASIAGDYAENLSIAFVYTSTETYSDVNGVNSDYRAATWSICDVMIKGVKDETSALKTNKLKTIKIYPNPTTGLVNFSQTIVSASIYTLQGQEVLTNNFTTHQLNASQLDKGIYFIKATTQDGNAVTARLILK